MKNLFLMLIFTFLTLQGNSIVGKWKTIDDETNKVKSIVEISEKSGKLYGKIIKLITEPGEDPDPVCKVCPDDRKDQNVVGMEIIRALEKDDDKWEGDEGILDPNNGKLYDCKIWLESKDKLAVRGYIGFFYRTQYWYRVK